MEKLIQEKRYYMSFFSGWHFFWITIILLYAFFLTPSSVYSMEIAVLKSSIAEGEYAKQHLGPYTVYFDEIITLLKRADINTTIITGNSIHNKYPVILFPLAVDISGTELSNLTHYIKNGGKVIVTLPGGTISTNIRQLLNLLAIDYVGRKNFETAIEFSWDSEGLSKTFPVSSNLGQVYVKSSGDIFAEFYYEDESIPAIVSSTSGVYIGWKLGNDLDATFNIDILKKLIGKLLGDEQDAAVSQLTDQEYKDELDYLDQIAREAKTALNTLIYTNKSTNISKIQEKLYLAEYHKTLFTEYYQDHNIPAALNELKLAKENILNAYMYSVPSSVIDGRALWVDRGTIVAHKTPEKMKELFNAIEKAGFNIVFFESLNAGYPIYNSTVVEQNPLVAGFDPLEYAVKEAHSRNIKLHVWFWIFAAGNTRHNILINKDKAFSGPIISNNFYEGAMISDRGTFLPKNQPEFWLDPSNKKVHTILLKLIEEVVTRYDIDGFQYDYIRYPFQSTTNLMGFNSLAREAFEKDTGYRLDHLDGYLLTIWTRWKTQQVTDFVEKASSLIRKVKPNIEISAAIFATEREERVKQIHQDWETWVNNGWIDILCPMIYAQDIETLYNKIKYIENTVEKKIVVYPGMELRKLSDNTLIEQLVAMKDRGVLGVAMFASAHLSDEKKEILALGPYKKKAVIIPNREPLAAVKLLIEDFIYKIEYLQSTGFINDYYHVGDTLLTKIKSLHELVHTPPAQKATWTKSNTATLSAGLDAVKTYLQNWLKIDMSTKPERFDYFNNKLNYLKSIISYL